MSPTQSTNSHNLDVFGCARHPHRQPHTSSDAHGRGAGELYAPWQIAHICSEGRADNSGQRVGRGWRGAGGGCAWMQAGSSTRRSKQKRAICRGPAIRPHCGHGHPSSCEVVLVDDVHTRKHMQHTDTLAITHMCIVVNIDRLCWGLWPTTRAVLPRTPDHRTGVPFDWEREDPEFYMGKETQDSPDPSPRLIDTNRRHARICEGQG